MFRTVVFTSVLSLPLLTLVARAGEEAPRKPTASRGAEASPSEETVKVLQLHVRAALKRLDADKDGQVTRKEYDAAFDRFDGDRNGTLDRQELLAAVEALASGKEVKADQRVITFAREHDVNKDGSFSREEARVLFDGADTDRDGALNEKEILAACAKLIPPPPDAAPTGLPPQVATPSTPASRPPQRLFRVIGRRVLVLRGEGPGTAVDVVAGEGGQIAYVIVQYGGGLAAVPWGAVAFGEGGRDLTLNAAITAEALRSVTFSQDRWPDFSSARWVESVRTVWGERVLEPRRDPRPGSRPDLRPDRRPDDRRAPVPPRQPGARPDDRRDPPPPTPPTPREPPASNKRDPLKR